MSAVIKFKKFEIVIIITSKLPHMQTLFCLENHLRTTSLWTQDKNLTYTKKLKRRSGRLLNVLCTFKLRSNYVLCPGG